MFTKADIEKYFTAEKNESLVFICIGILAILLAILFLYYFKTQWYKGFAIIFLITGLINLTIGYTIYKSCDESRKRNVYAYDMNVGALKTNEIPRMESVHKNWQFYQFVASVFLLGGLAMAFYFRNNMERAFWMGLGIALAIQATICLCLVFFAEKRAAQYIKGLHSFVDKPLQ